LHLVSRINAKQFALDVSPYDLCDITREAVVTVHAARGLEKGVQVHLKAQSVAISGDSHRLRQVVDNLLDNALRHAPAGSEILVRIARENGAAVLVVHDTGPGYPPRIRRTFLTGCTASTAHVRAIRAVSLSGEGSSEGIDHRIQFRSGDRTHLAPEIDQP